MYRTYILSSMPLLVLGDRPGVTVEEFLAVCERFAPEEECGDARLAAAGRWDETRGKAARAWARQESDLRTAVALLRMRRAGAEIPADFPEPDPDAMRAARDAFSRDDPLETERTLDRWRLTGLEAMAFGNPFGAAALVGYAGRLGICWRWARLDGERGAARAEELVAGLEEQALATWREGGEGGEGGEGPGAG